MEFAHHGQEKSEDFSQDAYQHLLLEVLGFMAENPQTPEPMPYEQFKAALKVVEQRCKRMGPEQRAATMKPIFQWATAEQFENWWRYVMEVSS